MADLLDDTRDALDRAEELARGADLEREKAGRLCARMADGGLSVQRIADGLDISTGKAQRLIALGRSK